MIVRRLHFAAACLGCMLGLTHLALAWPLVQRMTLDGLWFIGTGLAIVIAAAMNISVLLSRRGGQRGWTTGINLLMAAFFCLAWSVMKEPQVAVGLGLFIAMAGAALVVRAPDPQSGASGLKA